MKKVVMVLAMVLGTVSANAESARTPANSAQNWNCSFGFSGISTGLKILVGFYSFDGKGTLQCVSDAGQVATYPVKVTMRASPISPAISLGVMKVNAQAADFRLVGHNPDAVFGTYDLAQGQVAVLGGLGIVTAIHETEPTFSLKLALEFARGLGVNLGLNKMRVELDNNRQPEAN